MQIFTCPNACFDIGLNSPLLIFNPEKDVKLGGKLGKCLVDYPQNSYIILGGNGSNSLQEWSNGG